MPTVAAVSPEAAVDQLLADAAHYLPQTDKGVRQVRKELTPKRLQAAPALVLLERLAKEGAAVHPQPQAVKQWLKAHIPLGKWLPAAVEGYRAKTLDVALLRQHLAELELNSGSGYRRHFDEAFDAQRDSAEGLAEILDLATLKRRYNWASTLFHNLDRHYKGWGEPQIKQVISSLDAPLVDDRHDGMLDEVKAVWWGIGCGASLEGLRLMAARPWPLKSRDLHTLWEGALHHEVGEFIHAVSELTDAWWAEQDDATRASWPHGLLHKIIRSFFYRSPAMETWQFVDGRLGQGAFTGVTRAELAEKVIELWNDDRAREYSIIGDLDDYLAATVSEWKADSAAWAARGKLIATIGPKNLALANATQTI